MTPELVYCFGVIAHYQATIVGMQTENARRESEGMAHAHGQQAFDAIAEQIYELSVRALNSAHTG